MRTGPGLVATAAALAAVVVLIFGINCRESTGQDGGKPAAAPSPAPAPPPKKPAVDYLPVAGVRPGMKGYGLSVFSGTKIEKFDVEVVSVLKKYMGDKDIILVRVGHPVTDHANIIHGMSGSPIFLEGKIAGALALGFSPFPKDPLAGITPIEYMLADRDHPWENEDAFIPPLPKDASFQYCKTPLFASGLPPGAFGDLKEFLEPFGFAVLAGSAGQMDLAQDVKLEPGAAVGVRLVQGDIDLDAVGTVTFVSGEDVLVFGHPMDMGGQIELPMSTAYVHTVIPDQTYSYKLSSSLKTVGCFQKDRLTSVVGTLGKEARMTPMTVEVENAQTRNKRTFRFELARHPFYTPMLLSQLPEYCVMLSEAGSGKDKTVTYDLRLKFEGMPELQIKDAYVSSVMAGPSRDMMRTIFQLLGNPFRKLRLERVDVKLAVVHRLTTAMIDAAWLQTQQVKPGDTLRLTVRLRPYNRESVKETFEIPVPATLPDGDYELIVMGGRETEGRIDMQELMRAMMSGGQPGMGGDQSFEDLVERIRRRHPADRIVARLDLPAIGLRYKGQKLENLPGSVFVNLASTPSAGMRFERDQLEKTLDTAWVVEGYRTVNFEIRTPGRVAPEQQEPK